jgi:hypothetical protein
MCTLGPTQRSWTALLTGYDVWIGGLTIIDNAGPIDMLTSTNLPTSADFVTRANLVNVNIENFQGTRKITKTFDADEYTLTVTSTPEPSLRFLLLAVLAAVGIARPDRKFSKGLVE